MDRSHTPRVAALCSALLRERVTRCTLYFSGGVHRYTALRCASLRCASRNISCVLLAQRSDARRGVCVNDPLVCRRRNDAEARTRNSQSVAARTTERWSLVYSLVAVSI